MTNQSANRASASRMRAELHEPEPRGRHKWGMWGSYSRRHTGRIRICLRSCGAVHEEGQQEPYECEQYALISEDFGDA